jgi:uncharacterized membrane protein YedE/YeeE
MAVTRALPVVDSSYRESLVVVLPTVKQVDRPRVIGAVLFGIGWGLAGLCPGPAMTLLMGGDTRIVIFVGAMLVGLWADLLRIHWVAGRLASKAPPMTNARVGSQ